MQHAAPGTAAPQPAQQLLMVLAAALTLSAAWLLPTTTTGALFGWAAAASWSWLLASSTRPYRCAFIAGVLFHLITGSWLIQTIERFGGFPFAAALGVFLLFALSGSLQLLLVVFLTKHLPHRLSQWGLTIPLSWCALEAIFPRLFPWTFGHTQLGFLPLAQLADIAGVTLLSFTMLWCIALLQKRTRAGVCGAAVLLLIWFGYGSYSLQQLAATPATNLPVAIVQANIAVEEKRDISFIEINRARYEQLTRESVPPTTIDNQLNNILVIWPESVIQDFIPVSVGSRENTSKLPYLPAGQSLLTGALTYDSARRIYNSAVLVNASGEVPEPYHKRILMPFGEYMPGGDLLPWLNELNPAMANFTAGKVATVFPLTIGDTTTAIAPLICYEDIVPQLAREAVKAGAAVLVNLTNDGWFGTSVAALQHHQIASFRAIENRRTLIRSTNTGVTAIVDASGATVASLPEWSEGVLFGAIESRNDRSLFLVWGELPWQLLGWGILGAALLQLWSKRRSILPSDHRS